MGILVLLSVKKSTHYQNNGTGNYLLQRETPHYKITGRPCDITDFCGYGCYKWVKYRSKGRKFTFPSEQLGRCLGPAKHDGNSTIQHILDTGDVLPLQTIRPLTPAYINSSTKDENRKQFNLIIREKFGDLLRPPTPISEEPSKYDDIEEPSKIPEADDFVDYYLYIDSEVLLPQNGEYTRAAKVVDRTKNQDGKVNGYHNTNTILDTRIYDFMFPDVSIQQYTANIIAEHI